MTEYISRLFDTKHIVLFIIVGLVLTQILVNILYCQRQRRIKIDGTPNTIPKPKDSIRFYKRCESCLAQVEIIGEGSVARDQLYYIV